MKRLVLPKLAVLSAFILLLVTANSCKTASDAQNYSEFNYNNLYNAWVVDTIIVLETDDFSTPDLEMNKNEYKFTKDESNPNQGKRTAITPLGPSIITEFTIEDGTIYFPNVLYDISKFDEDGKLISYNPYGVPIPPYEITELTSTKLTLKNKDITIKLKAK